MLFPAIILCYAVSIPMQKLFDQLTGSISKQKQEQHLVIPKN
jgi:hypothetical protein